MVPVDPLSMASDPAHTVIPYNLLTHEALERVDEENEAGNTGESGKASCGLGLEDFDLLRVIGRGSYGKVLLVQQKESNSTSVLEGFLNKDPKEQLDCHPHRGFADIQKHPFFQNVDWDMMEQKQVEPPFKPNTSEQFSLDNLDPEFTNEYFQLIPDDNDVLREIDGYEFAGFEYINHLLMYEEGV
ncbi:Protein kinase C iota type [Heterocephalus glaber]|uniref:Protein kinase C iota type n=1 Tax=Heterocephalus glaber TaxID=10181 RepID=G5AKE3_HETGA|nr:Protein kinase C iota type [Heterocephalus glaber]